MFLDVSQMDHSIFPIACRNSLSTKLVNEIFWNFQCMKLSFKHADIHAGIQSV